MNNPDVIVPLLVLVILPAPSVPPPASPPPDASLLRGPTVPESAIRSLVDFDARGEFIRVEGRPEVAAVAVATLAPEHRELVRLAIADREQLLGLFLVDHVDLVKEATDAIKAGDLERVEAIYRDAYDLFDSDHDRDPLLPRFAELLTPQEYQQVARLVDEYWQAWIDWELRGDNDPPDQVREQTEQRLSFLLFREELGQAYRWSLGPFREKLETLYDVTQATPTQRAAIREAIIDYIRESRLSPTVDQQRSTADRIYSVLEEEQRRRLFERSLWRR